MSYGRKGEFGYGAVREYRDDPDDPGFGRPASGSRGGYQATGNRRNFDYLTPF